MIEPGWYKYNSSEVGSHFCKTMSLKKTTRPSVLHIQNFIHMLYVGFTYILLNHPRLECWIIFKMCFAWVEMSINKDRINRRREKVRGIDYTNWCDPTKVPKHNRHG